MRVPVEHGPANESSESSYVGRKIPYWAIAWLRDLGVVDHVNLFHPNEATEEVARRILVLRDWVTDPEAPDLLLAIHFNRKTIVLGPAGDGQRAKIVWLSEL